MCLVSHGSYRFVMTIRYGLHGIPTAPLSLERALGEQQVRVVSVRDLNRSTSAGLASLVDGQRVLITKHLEPVGVLLTVRDAIALFARAFAQDGPPREEVRERLAQMRGRDRGELRRLTTCLDLGVDPPAAGGGPGNGCYWTSSGRWLAMLADPESAERPDPDGGCGTGWLADLLSGPELERLLVGEELWASRRKQDLGRLQHGRLGPRRPGRPPAGRER